MWQPSSLAVPVSVAAIVFKTFVVTPPSPDGCYFLSGAFPVVPSYSLLPL